MSGIVGRVWRSLPENAQDYTLTLTIRVYSVDVKPRVGAMVRCNGDETAISGYEGELDCQSSVWRLTKYVDNEPEQLAVLPLTYEISGGDHVLAVAVLEDVVSLQFDGELILEAQDSSPIVDGSGAAFFMFQEGDVRDEAGFLTLSSNVTVSS